MAAREKKNVCVLSLTSLMIVFVTIGKIFKNVKVLLSLVHYPFSEYFLGIIDNHSSGYVNFHHYTYSRQVHID